jgi:benzoate-CoA ligase
MLELNLPRQFNAADYFVDRNVAEGRGDKTAILYEDQAVTYERLMENVNRVANVLTELGVGMEERVMLLVRDTPEMLYAFYGGFSLHAQRQPGPGFDC